MSMLRWSLLAFLMIDAYTCHWNHEETFRFQGVRAGRGGSSVVAAAARLGVLLGMEVVVRTPLRLYGGSRKNNLKLRKKRHQYSLRAAYTNGVEKVIKRQRKIENHLLREARKSVLAVKDGGSAVQTNSSALVLLAPPPAKFGITDELIAQQEIVPTDIYHFPGFPSIAKARRKKARGRLTPFQKKEAIRLRKMIARFEATGADYEKVKASGSGIGAALLIGNTCDGCRLAINAVEMERIKSLDSEEVLRCEECRRILVRI